MNQPKSVKTLLVVEDDPGLQSQLKWCFEDYDVVIAGDRDSALVQLRRHNPQVVLLDLGLPPDPENASEGLAALEQILTLAPATKVIVVTGNEERSNAVRAIALGAYDFYQKPIDPQTLGLIAQRAFQLHELEAENRRLAAKTGGSPLKGIITGSPEMLSVCRTVERVAPSNATVMILGESGTGKELVARAVHDLSGRSDGRFVVINCAAIPDTLLESELFGYEKGAYTGAHKQTIGKIEYASGGTLFLDEIGDLPLALQAKMLRFLQERVVERLGGRGEIPVDVRVICATHQDLDVMVRERTFREDLYYRLSEITLRIPPLRVRAGDALVLARSFLEKYCEENRRNIRGFSPEANDALQAYPWPGNVRELENRVKRAVIMAEGQQITLADIDLPAAGGTEPLNLRQVRDEAEQRALARALSLCGSNISRAAELLGVSRPTLYSLMEKYHLK